MTSKCTFELLLTTIEKCNRAISLEIYKGYAQWARVQKDQCEARLNQFDPFQTGCPCWQR